MSQTPLVNIPGHCPHLAPKVTSGWFSTEPVSPGLNVQGSIWRRAEDSIGLGGVANGLSILQRRYLEAGGVGILNGDGALSYGWEEALEFYYNCAIWKSVHLSVDYQYVANPANNRDRGPVSVLGGRLQWEF